MKKHVTGAGEYPLVSSKPGHLLLILALALTFLPVLHTPANAQEKEKRDPALDLFYSANALYNRDLYETAVEEYREFLSKHGNHEKAAQAKFGLALSYYSMGEYGKAEPLFEKLRTNGNIEDRERIQNLWGYSLLSLEKYETAADAFDWTVQNSDDGERKREALAGLVEAHFRIKNWTDVVEHAGTYISQHKDASQAPRVMFQSASARFQLQEYEPAIKTLKSLLSRFPESNFTHYATFLLAECRRKTDKLDRAAELYSRVANEQEGPYTAEALYRVGFVRFQQKKYEQAVDTLKTYLNRHEEEPSVPNAKYFLARAHLENGNRDQSISLLKELQSVESVAGKAVLWLARAHARDKEHEKAGNVLAKHLDRFRKSDHPLLSDMLYEHGLALREQDKFGEAAEQFRKTIEADEDGSLSAGALYLQAYCVHQQEKYDKARTLCEQFLDRYKDHDNRGDVLFLLGESLFLNDGREDALSTLRRFVENHPDHEQVPAAHLRIGQIHYREKRWEKALEHLKPLVKKAPDRPVFSPVGFLVGDSHFQLEQWEPAIKAFKRFTDDHGESPHADLAYLKLALAHRRTENVDRAKNALEKLVKNFEDSPHLDEAYVELGRMYYENEQYDTARETLRKTPDLEDHPRALYYLAWALRQEGNTEKAASHFHTLAEKHGDHDLAADALLQHAVLSIEQQQAYERAQNSLQRILENHPEFEKNDRVQFHLGLSLAHRQKWDEAADRFRNVVEEFDRSPVSDRALYRWAWAEKNLDRNDNAAERYRTLLDNHPDSDLADDAALELAELTYQAEEYETAVKQLEKLVENTGDPSIRNRALYRLGWSYRKQEKFSEAADRFESVLKGDDDLKSTLAIRASYQAGEARLERKEHESAYEHFRRAVEKLRELKDEKNENDLRDIHERALLRYGETAAQVGNWSESLKVHRRFLETFPDSELTVRARFGVGWALENQEKYDSAIKAYRKVVNSDQKGPTAARCQFQIGECHFAADRPEKALRELIKVTTKYGHRNWSAQALLEMGRVLESQEKPEKAAERYREVVEEYEETDAAEAAQQRLSKLSKK